MMRHCGILAQEEFLIFADLQLARRIEAAEAANARGCTAIHPEAATLDVAGGCAVFVGAESPLSHAVGIGLNGPCHRSRKSTVWRRSSAAAAPRSRSNSARWPTRGLLARPGRPRLLRDGIQQRAGEAAGRDHDCPDARACASPWPMRPTCGATPSAGASSRRANLTTEEMDVGRAICAMPGAMCYLAVTESGELAGGAAAAIYGGLATLFADSTIARLPAHRSAPRTDCRAPERGPRPRVRTGHRRHSARQRLAAKLRATGFSRSSTPASPMECSLTLI